MEVILFSYFTHTYTYLQHLLKVWTVGFCFLFFCFFGCFFFFFLSALAVALTTGLGDLCTCT